MSLMDSAVMLFVGGALALFLGGGIHIVGAAVRPLIGDRGLEDAGAFIMTIGVASICFAVVLAGLHWLPTLVGALLQ